ncbi:MAG: TonB-dependent receptor, partial [Campylobacterota bacterium]|nr:TonB-dependent receptor [Campylobacterota bacterium]
NYRFASVELFDDYYFKSESQRLGVFHQSDYELGSHLISFGGEFQHLVLPLDLNVSRPPSPNDPDFDFTTEEKIYVNETLRLNNISLFLQDTWQFHEDLNLRYGLRYSSSDYQEFQHLVDPRVSLVYQLGSYDALSFSAGRYSQIPEGFKTNEDFGSTTLSYERSNHYMLAYNHSDELIEYSIQPFYKTFSDLAIDVLDTNGSTESYASKGEGDAYGIDLSAKYRDGRYYAFVAYTYLNATRQVSTDDPHKYPFYGDIPHTLQMVGSIRFWDNWAFSVLSKYSTGKPYTPVVGTYTDPDDARVRPIYGDLFSERLPDYFTLNLKIGQKVNLEKGSSISWSFELMNATNHQNVTDIRYDDNYNIEGYNEQLPLLPWFDVTYRF